MYLALCSSHQTIQFAANELKHYLYKSGIMNVNIIPFHAIEQESPLIYLGTTADFCQLNIRNINLCDNKIDDCFQINIDNGKGYVVGSNPRSVLFAVYSLLREIGFDWPNPVTEIYLPNSNLNLNQFSFQIEHHASIRHRGIVLEGANNITNVTQLIAWLPKLYYNSYFLQFQIPYTFFANWYQHVGNPYLKPQDFSEKDALNFKKTIETELNKRDLLYHAVGHAWTSQSIGIKGLSWDPKYISLTDWQTKHLALVNGKRELFNQITLNTNLCYSDPESLELFGEQVLKYMQENPSTDFLHIWLADGFNNFCECPKCIDKRPSDQYIDLLNYLDAILTQNQISVKLVFLIYYDLMWAPQTQKLLNPDRFLLMFAPISRTFESSYADVEQVPESVPYHKNKINLPHSVEENLSYLKDWQKVFNGDSFVFDYPLGRAHYGDPGYIKIAHTIYHDIKTLHQLGLNGYLSCQEQRCFFPHALPNYLMGLTLWDSKLSFEEICNNFFQHSYGQNAKEVYDILEKISYAFNTDYWNHVIPHYQPWYAQQLLVIPKYADQLETLIETNLEYWQNQQPLNDSTLSYYTNWHTLSYLPEYLRKLSLCLSAKAKGEGVEAQKKFHDFEHYVQKNEYNLQPFLDVFRLLNLAYNYVELDQPEKNGK